jgi:osmoprotectant transport system substrate-binding protein
MHAVLRRTLGGRGVTVLDPAPAEDQNGFAVTAGFAGEHGVRRLSDLRTLAATLTFGAPPECPDRPLCLPGLEKTYGLHFRQVRAMPSRAATVEALLAGEIDVGLLETTDARLTNARITLLDDDRGLQPAENIVPLVRTAALERWGDELPRALNEVSAHLTTDDLRQLNKVVELDDLTSAQAAARWWQDH